MQALFRLTVDCSSWMSPMLKQRREMEELRVTEEEGWFTLQEKLSLLGREEDRSPEIIEQITNKIYPLVAFMDYNREIVRKLVAIGRFAAFDSDKVIFDKGTDPRAAYLIISGQVRLVSNEPPPLPYQVMTHTAGVRIKNYPAPHITQEITVKRTREIIGDQEILAGHVRKETAYTEGTVELISFNKKDFLELITPVTLDSWETTIKDLRKYRLFRFFDIKTLKEVVKFAKYMTLRPRKFIPMNFDEDGHPELCYFLLNGTCQVIQRILVVRDDKKKGFDKFRLYYWQEQDVYPEWVEAVYMRVCYIKRGAFFGIGERLSRQHLFTEATCRFLTLPNKLLRYVRKHLPAFDEALELLDEVFPYTIDVYLAYVYGRLWKEYSQRKLNECRKRGGNLNNVHDVPVSLRAASMKPKSIGFERISMHPDYMFGRDYYDVVKELERRKKRKNQLNDFREHVFGHYRTEVKTK